jgi:hypothetical protein
MIIYFTRGTLFEKTVPLDPLQKLFIRGAHGVSVQIWGKKIFVYLCVTSWLKNLGGLVPWWLNTARR